MSNVAPPRTNDQRTDALQRANAVRQWRADLKVRMHNGEITATAVLTEPPPSAATMKVQDLLLRIPQVGKVKANKILRDAGVSPSKTVAGISDRQRRVLLKALDGR